MLLEQCKGVYCVDLGDSFQTYIYLQNFVSIQPRTSPDKFARSRNPTSSVARLAHRSPSAVMAGLTGKGKGGYPGGFPGSACWAVDSLVPCQWTSPFGNRAKMISWYWNHPMVGRVNFVASEDFWSPRFGADPLSWMGGKGASGSAGLCPKRCSSCLGNYNVCVFI